MENIFNKFKLYLKAKGNSERTIEYYIWHTEKFLQYTEAKISDYGNLKKFRERYYIIIDRPSLSNESKKKHLKCARIFADFLIEEEKIEINAPRLISPPKVQTRLPIIVEDEEINSVFYTIDKRWSGFLHLRNSILVETFLYTGLRRNELLNLKRENIFENKIFVNSGKGGKDRSIYIPDHFYEKLIEYIKVTSGVSEYLFYSVRKGKLSKSGIKKIFDEIKKKAGIKVLHPHRLRHTYASRMIEQGIDIAVVKEQMGHANISTTNRYIAVRDSHRKAVIQNLKF
ncbi:hypothetical protein DLH72_02090 [Candidatus Gracilibacteria bacterium]|nr:MAG: hypothetical protein DLH72_02090 [Candidatus Gracilibacteria bacterium]